MVRSHWKVGEPVSANKPQVDSHGSLILAIDELHRKVESPYLKDLSQLALDYAKHSQAEAQKLTDFAHSVARSACLSQKVSGKCICFSCEAKRLIDTKGGHL